MNLFPQRVIVDAVVFWVHGSQRTVRKGHRWGGHRCTTGCESLGSGCSRGGITSCSRYTEVEKDKSC